MAGTAVLRQGSGGGPRLYAVHGLDGDILGFSYGTLAQHLTAWRVVALVLDEEAHACGSLPSLAACYNRRVLADVVETGGTSEHSPILVAGYSFGCVLAHQMAYQLHKDGHHVLLVLFDLEVTWPPPPSTARVGGYDFLGGEAEAVLLLCRAMGHFDFALAAVDELTARRKRNERLDVERLEKEAYKVVAQRGLTSELFSMLVKRGGKNIQKLHTLADPWQPPEVHPGPSLLVLAPDSAEFATAREVNEQYCSDMEVVYGRGSHYNLLQGEHAHLAGDLLQKFSRRFFAAMPEAVRGAVPAVPEDQLLILRTGSPKAPKIYLVHGLDGDVMSGGATFKTIAQDLAPCRVGALIYDAQALAESSVPSLCALYNTRVMRDAGQDALVVIAGYSFGCVLAHQMGHQLAQTGVNVAVVMFDLEVTWPPPQTNSRVGGYDFLGGEAEAILLISRGFGKFEFAVQEAMELAELRRRKESFDVDALRERAFHALNQRGLSMELFTLLVKRGGVNIQQLHSIADPWEPPEKLKAPALLVLAPDSHEFASAREINARYCDAMEVVTGLGSHYNMMQKPQAAVQALRVKEFLQRLPGMDGSIFKDAPPDRAPAPAVGEEKLLVLRRGAPGAAKVYLIHGLDGDVMSGGATFKTIAKDLEPFRVAALLYDSEALSCNSVPSLCALYNQRVLQDAQHAGPIIVAGYSFGCVLAHQMGSQLQEAGVDVAVVMFDLEVTWPPPKTNSRVGGYDFLGGEAEAILLISRGFGKFEFAVKEAMHLTELRRKKEDFDVDALRHRAYEALQQRGLSLELFTLLVKRGGVNIQQLHSIADPWQPPKTYDGPALLVLAPDSQEFAGAKEINAQFCTHMEVVVGAGSHYNMMQAEQAAVQAQIVKDFVQRLPAAAVGPPRDRANEPLAAQPAKPAEKLLILRPGQAESAKVYLVHGLDGDALSGGSTFKTLAQRLVSCRVAALLYEDEALACSSVPELAACYNRRVLEDAKDAGLIVVAGYSYGCVLAHQMGHQLHEAGHRVAVVMFDLEVTWPPPSTNARVGGYDFLGGEAEAILLISRAFGKFDFAIQEAVELTAKQKAGAGLDVDALCARAYAALNQRGLSEDLFALLVKRAGVNIEKLQHLGNPWEPPEVYPGPALLVLAPDTPEFHGSVEINGRFCSQMQVVMGKGSHYNMMQGENAAVQAALVLDFIKRLSELTAGAEGLRLLHDGPGPCSYFLHGLDGDALGPGCLGELPQHLRGRVCAVEYDDEAFACESLEALVTLYLRRIRKDYLACKGELLLAGRSIGALLAGIMAVQLQKEGVTCSLVILDSEVVWPSKLDQSFCYDWLGGEVEATFALARLLGAKDFVEEQVQKAARGTSFAEGASRLQTAAFAHVASNLKAFGITSLKDFRSLCTLASSNCARLRQLLRPTSGSQRTVHELFEGPVLLLSGEDRLARVQQVASAYFRNITARSLKMDAEDIYVGSTSLAIAEAIAEFLTPQEKPQAALTGKSVRDVHEEAPEVACRYLVPGCDGGILGDLEALADVLDACQLSLDEEAQSCSELTDLATLLLRRIFREQNWEEDSMQKVLLIGYENGAALAYELAMLMQDLNVDVRLVLLHGEVCCCRGALGAWRSPTVEALLALALRLEGPDLAKQLLPRAECRGRHTTYGLIADGISGAYWNGHAKDGKSEEPLLMKAFWKLSELLNGMSVESFKELVAELAYRMDWFVSLGTSMRHDDAFNGPALLLLGEVEDSEAMVTSNSLYCTQLDVLSMGEPTFTTAAKARAIAAEILSWQDQCADAPNGRSRS